MANAHAAKRTTDSPTRESGSSLALALRRVLLVSEELRLQMAQRLGLNRNETVAVEHLMGEPLGPVELSRRLHISSAAATVLLTRLEEAGHVKREADTVDRRRREARLRPAALREARAEVDPVIAAILQAEQGLTASERRVVARYLDSVSSNLDAIATAGK